MSTIVLIQLNKPLQNHIQNWNVTLRLCLLAEVQLAIPNACSSSLMSNYISTGQAGLSRTLGQTRMWPLTSAVNLYFKMHLSLCLARGMA